MAAAQGSSEPAASRSEIVNGISGNPAATTSTLGTGWLGRTLGLRDDWGVRLGGVWLADTNLVAAGGVQPGGWTSNSALFLSLAVDAEKLVGWRGASFDFQFLQLNAANTNAQAGSVQSYNGITGVPPFQRTEVYQAWYEQVLIRDVLKMRIGRMVPTLDFNNVLRPVALTDIDDNIPSLSGVLYATIFVNGSMLGAMPGYDPGDGVTVNFTPSKSFYFNVGVYGGNQARGIQGGVNAPQFNGYFFNVAEIGTSWTLGSGRHPGQLGVGLWRQTGVLTAAGVSDDGTGGAYLFGSQRLANKLNDRVAGSSVNMFYQFGMNQSRTLPITQYFGAGLTAFGLIGERARDSMGLGMALSRLNPLLFARPTELMFQAYYQAHLYGSVFLQPTVTFIPAPGAAPDLPATVTTTMRLTVLF